MLKYLINCQFHRFGTGFRRRHVYVCMWIHIHTCMCVYIHVLGRTLVCTKDHRHTPTVPCNISIAHFPSWNGSRYSRVSMTL